ncbi:protein-S-isoprenylcysteine O-methyltransferase [Sphingomonas sp. RP10(2022)]|uniref:Protein-S-isoprenylcysteine O-methyltransferase n=1 Tax=Sphingomonas liriopis TaxID=2949094 RepID=A0A9X2KSD8_9SPHN|nr:protein-S-isoprenylcysteine O-methyltransferase [Sphingomonas liriopis]MCP3733678.1 protein-S-isoprenylcysteine O-methyltransferase [Sphingomonas liriopis]
MYHDPALAAQAAADPRPASAVSHGVGLVGLAGLLVWLATAYAIGMDGPYAALCGLLACALPMVGWSLLVDKVHRSASTGIDWHAPKPLIETRDASLTKLAGLFVTWGGIAVIYGLGPFYWEGNFAFAMWCFSWAVPVVAVIAVPYVLWLDRYLVEPRDGAWHVGAWLTGQGGVDPRAIHDHLRNWAVKGFFLAFMLAVVPGNYAGFIRTPPATLTDPVAIAQWLIALMFVIDVAFATVGYILTLRPLDAHIRSANPFAAAWTAALMCYPPFILMDGGGPLDYHRGTQEWMDWFAGHPLLLGAWGAMLVVLTAIYAWATVAFGLRFSNLTHRGILTHGPYAWSRHPAYLSKNLFWWLSTLPILTTGSLTDAVRATLLMAVVSGVYYWRARTEERHLGLDPAYRVYSDWMTRRGAVPRFGRWLVGW